MGTEPSGYEPSPAAVPASATAARAVERPGVSGRPPARPPISPRSAEPRQVAAESGQAGAEGGRQAPPDGGSGDGVHLGAPAELRRACERLREDVALLGLPLEVPGADEARRELVTLVSQLDDYLLPRLRRLDAPLLAVVGGSTGAGKSTLVNSLVRRFVTRSGVLRPTTRSPVLIHHPYDSGAFLTQRILPGFARVTSEAPEPLQPVDVDAPRVTALRLVPDDGLAPGLAIIDAPDIDSLVETNRELALQLFAAADLWIFVTTAARYSDAVPWDTLKSAVDRGVSVAVVLDRVPVEAMAEIRVHLATMLRDRGLSTAPLFTIPETTKDVDGFLPVDVVRPLHGWLSRLARDSRTRDVVVRRTLVGALDSLHERVQTLTAAARAQAVADRELRTAVQEEFVAAARHLATALRDGSLLQGDVHARWQEYVGSGEAFRGFDGTAGRLRDRLSASLRGRPSPSGPLAEAVRKAVSALAETAAESAAEAVARRWRARPAGVALIARVEPPHGLAAQVERIVHDWQSGLQDVVHARTHGARPNARAAAFGVEGIAALLGVLAFGDGSALAGDGSALAGDGSGAVTRVAHRLLTTVLGDDVDALATSARRALHARFDDLLAAERGRFDAVTAAAGVRPDLVDALRGHLAQMEKAR